MATRYVTLASVKQAGRTGDGWDSLLTSLIEAAEADIDNMAGRRFDLTEETRRFRVEVPDRLRIGDFTEIKSVTVAFAELASSTWEADVIGRNGRPDRDLRLAAPLPVGEIASVKAKFGWAEVPAPITAAARLAAIRLFRRSEFSEGIVVGDGGQAAYIPRTDPDVRRLVAPYRLLGLASARGGV